jgi:multiple sugar transport system permease protein
MALALGVIGAGGTYVAMHPGPTPTPAQFTSAVAQTGSDQAARVSFQQVLERHQLDVRSAKAAAALFLALGVITAIGLGGGVVVFRTIFYLPSLLAGIALFLLWKSLYKPTGGAVNELLGPPCDWLQSTVSATPAGMWYALGIALWIVAALACGSLLLLCLRKRTEGDFGSLSLIGAALAVASLAACAFGVGFALCQLPARALFATGYETFTHGEVASLRAELHVADTGLDAAEINLIFDTLGASIEPRLLMESLESAIDDRGIAHAAREIVLSHATSAHAGFTSGDGLAPPRWLVDERWAKPALIIMGVWTAVGGANMLLFLAGLSNVPPELLEAAEIDGAGTWRRFWNVTWPQLAPTTFFIVIMSTIGGLQGGFDQARAMTQGKYGTEVLTYYIYKLAFTDEFQLGVASAVAWAMFAVIFAMTVLNYGLGNRALND